ncbi:Alpha/Beta hydrolase protein [Mycena sp. CBHHK59/15]|nr:Alpha/Beta hydrolase protein [Mycena sp. CBHHK59/15]
MHPLTSKHLISKDGTEILAEATGDPTKPHVIFVHGFTCTATAFDPLFKLEALTKNLFMVRYDTRGHGRSGKPQKAEDYESVHYAEDFQAVVDGFELNNPIYVGWSLGGTILADICAHIVPLPIAAAMWIAPHPYMDYTPSIPSSKQQDGAKFAMGMMSSDPGVVLQSRIDFCEAFVAPGREVPFADMLGWVGATSFLPPSTMGFVMTRKQDATPLKKTAAVGLPMFLIYGSEDLLIPCDAVAVDMKPLFTDWEVVVLEGIGHIPFWEDPELFGGHILRFVKRVSK